MNDRVVVVCTILLASGYLYATSRLPILENVDPLGPKVFPVLLGIGMVLSAVLLIVEMIINKDQVHKAERKREQTRIHLLLVGGVACWTFIYFYLLEPLGYLLSSSIYLFVFMAYFNRNKWYANTIVAILFSVATFALFVKGLGATLPKGILSF
jgi:putative tricarboxylic transport membrane protein